MKSNNKRTLNIISLIIISAACLKPSQIFAQPVVSYDTYKKEKLSQIQTKIDQIHKLYSSDSAVKEYLNRICTIDEVSAIIIKCLQSKKTNTFDKILDDILSEEVKIDNTKQDLIAISAIDIYERYRSDFSNALPKPRIKDSELTVLRDYYTAALKVAGDYIIDTSKSIVLVDDKLRTDLIEYYAVLPFLAVSDENWSITNLSQFTNELKSQDTMARFSDFALKLQRPRTALVFVENYPNNDKKWSNENRCEYLIQKADLFEKAGDGWKSAVACLKYASILLEKENKIDEAIELKIRIAKIYDKSANYSLAAAMIQGVMNANVPSSRWRELAILRLVYLYKANQMQSVIEEYNSYINDKRVAGAEPNIMYLACMAHRKLQNAEAAKELSDAFLLKYPSHSLAPDFYFMSAMEFLASGDYDEAGNRLGIIIDKFPKSELAKKAANIKESLNKARNPPEKNN